AGVAPHLGPQGVLVLEIGHERAHFDAAFPRLEAVWLPTSAGDDQVLLLTREALAGDAATAIRSDGSTPAAGRKGRA
ncbi:MAG TPA: hypothetical protein PKD25_12910, partial [Rubrivivax sp.]|nr:hypothetical protein [Rubrivivax sp.]